MPMMLNSWISSTAELLGSVDRAEPAERALHLAEIRPHELAEALVMALRNDCVDWSSAASASAARAAALFVTVASAQLRGGGLGRQERQRLFSLATLVLNQALAECNRMAISTEYAQLAMVGARLIDHCPDIPQAAKLASIIPYFDRAFETLDLASDSPSAASDLALVILDRLLAAGNAGLSNQIYKFFVSKAERQTETRRLNSPDLLLLARASIKALTHRDPEQIRMATDLARRAHSMALLEEDHGVAAKAKLFVGQLILDLSNCPDLLVQAGVLELGAEVTDVAARATAEMEVAFTHSVVSHLDVHADVCRRLGALLARSWIEGAESDYAPAKRAETLLSTAVQHCTGSDRIVAARNLAALRLELLVQGVQGSHCDVRSTIGQTLKWALDSEDEGLAQSCRELDGSHALFALASIDDSALSRLLTPHAPIPGTLHHFVMAVDLDSPCGQSDRVIFLCADASMSEGKVTLVRSGASLVGHFQSPCAVCRKLMHMVTPLIIDLDRDFESMSEVMRMSFLGTRCIACGTLNRVQVVFTLKSKTLNAAASIVVPSAWKDHFSDLDKRQLAIVRSIHDTYSVFKLPIACALLPWTDIPRVLNGMSFEALRLEHGRSAVVDLMVAIVGQNITSANAVLARNLGIEALLMNLSAADCREISLEVGNQIGSSIVDQQLAMKSCEQVMEVLKAQGMTAIDAAFQSVTRLRADAYSAEVFESAMAVATDDECRLRFLKAYLDHAPRISADRERNIYSTMMLDLRDANWEERAGRDADGESDDRVGRFKNELIDRARRETQEWVLREQQQSTTPRALALLASAVASTGRFVLFLRPFDIETGTRKHIGHTDDPRIGIRMSAISPRNSSRLLEKELGQRDDVLAITNSDDWHSAVAAAYPELRRGVGSPIDLFARLNVDDANWRYLAFSLCAEARKILLLLPCAELGNEGIAEELSAIARLSAQPRTIVILDAGADEGAFQRAKSRISPFGFDCILSRTDIGQVTRLL